MTVAVLAVAFVDEGTALFLDALAGLSDAELDAPCALPSWTRRHLLLLVTPDGARELPGADGARRVELPLGDAAARLTGRDDRPDLPVLSRWL